MLKGGIHHDITDLTSTVSVVESLRLDDELQEIKDILKLKKLKASRSLIRDSGRYETKDVEGAVGMSKLSETTENVEQIEISDTPDSDPSVISISPGEYDKHLSTEHVARVMKKRRIKKQNRFHKIVMKSNAKIVDYLKKTIDSALSSGGVDIYTYFNFIGEISHGTEQPTVVEKTHRFKRFMISFPTKFYKFYTALIVIAIQLVVPCVLLTAQLYNANFQPIIANIWFRIVGFLVMSYSTADLRNQIIDQVNWIMIDNNKIIRRISKKIVRPNIVWLYIGLYTNMIMSVVVCTNIYLLYCASTSIIDLILNTVALNFLLLIDNSAFNMLVSNSDVMEIVRRRAEEQIDTMLEKANFHEIRIIRRMHPTLEYYLFYAVSIYTLVLPFVFLLYDINHVSLEISE